MPPTPVLHTEQISLRQFTPEDAAALHAYLSHPELSGRRYIHWKFEQNLPIPLQSAEKIIAKWTEAEDSFTYAVIKKDDQSLIGHVSADWEWDPHMPDCAVAIDPEHQRQGYGTQALSLVLDYLYDFTMAHNVSIWIVEWNQPARAFIEKMGFTNVGQLRRADYHGGQFYDELVFDLLRPEWKERRHAA